MCRNGSRIGSTLNTSSDEQLSESTRNETHRNTKVQGCGSWLWKSNNIFDSRFRSGKYVKSRSGRRGKAVERHWDGRSVLLIVPANKHMLCSQTTRTESIIDRYNRAYLKPSSGYWAHSTIQSLCSRLFKAILHVSQCVCVCVCQY